jgi:hypothetical protein
LFCIAAVSQPAFPQDLAGDLKPIPPASIAQVPLAPNYDDQSAASLRQFAAALTAHYGTHRDVPLDVKAEYFAWQLWRYHLTPFHQVYNRADLADQAGVPAQWVPGSDSSTWNGALLAALSFQYAVTRDNATLQRIAELLNGLHLFQTASGKVGFLVRNVSREQDRRNPDMLASQAPDGTQWYCRADPAKGTYNQVVAGYVALMMLAYADLPPESQRLARSDLAELVLHVVDHDYHLTNGAGKRTPYGDLTPVIASVGVPFNSQLAYMIVAAGYYFPPDDPQQRARIEKAYRFLRDKHHAYYEDRLRNLVQPQRAAVSPFIKGMNDRNHLTNATFMGLWLDAELARRQGTPLDERFVFQLGRTLHFCQQSLSNNPNSLCQFMCAGLIFNPVLRPQLLDGRESEGLARAEQGLKLGFEQLRRYPLDRFFVPGKPLPTREYQWIDSAMVDEYHWKADPQQAWQPTGPATNEVYCAIDYLYAYWLARYFRLDGHPSVASEYRPILTPTAGVASWFTSDTPALMP